MVRKMLLLTAMLCTAFIPFAQVMNPGFELSRPDGTIANWEARTVFAVSVDSTTGCALDSTFFRTGDAHTGSGALELRSILCQGAVTYARVFASDDIPAFGPSVPLASRPAFLSFYYKLYPSGGDGFRLSLQLTDADGVTIASADTAIYTQAPVTTYTRHELPLIYESASLPTRLFLSVSLVGADGNILHEGSRLLLDDFATGNATALHDAGDSHQQLRCYPVPARDWVSLEWKSRGPDAMLALFRADGSLVRKAPLASPGRARLSVAGLSPGIYIIRITDRAGSWTCRLPVIK